MTGTKPDNFANALEADTGGTAPVCPDGTGKLGRRTPQAASFGGNVIAANEWPVPYPFVRALVSLFDGDGYSETETWRPGIEFAQYGPEDVEAIANGMGSMVLTVVSEHKPGRFPARVFYTRRWIDPDGKEFGKGSLHIATKQKFNRLCRGYAHDFRLDDRRVQNGLFQEVQS